MERPPWLEQAWRLLGEHEISGARHNAEIVALFRDTGNASVSDDETAWCAAFVGACLRRSDVEGTGSLRARSYLDWGHEIEVPRLGAVAVLSRGPDPSLGHVGFVVGWSSDELMLLGGNQGDAVSVAAFPRTRLLSLRWPDRSSAIGTEVAAAPPGTYEQALRHVLSMEGGFTDDPYDPGGPTNRGITLRVLSEWRGVSPDALNAARLRSDLLAIDDATVSAIYEARYWRPAACTLLPGPLALMHFDAAVNHGVGTAIRLLQEAVATDVDGEVGPLTLAAVRSRPTRDSLERYASLRRDRYRRLPHFWRFGRGWLARVDKTLAAARGLAPAGSEHPSITEKGPSSMEGIEPSRAAPDSKWWGSSVTIWGALISVLATVLPALGPALGIDITGDLVREVGQHAVNVAQALAGLVGALLTIYGRLRASQPLERRLVRLRL